MMVAYDADMFLLALMIYIVFAVRRQSFQQPGVVSVTLHEEDLCKDDEIFINASLFSYQRKISYVKTSR